MTDRIQHFHLKDVELDPDKELMFPARLYADVIDMTNNLIVDACVKAARQAGINDLFLLDRNFVLAALREKVERMRGEIP